MSKTSHHTRTRRFWLLLAGICALDGAAAMIGYALLFGYLGWAPIGDPTLDFGEFAFLIVLLLIGAASLILIGRLYKFKALGLPWAIPGYRTPVSAVIVGVLSALFGGLFTVQAVRAFYGGGTLFDDGRMHLFALMMAVLVSVFAVAPALDHGEHELAERRKAASGTGGTGA